MTAGNELNKLSSTCIAIIIDAWPSNELKRLVLVIVQIATGIVISYGLFRNSIINHKCHTKQKCIPVCAFTCRYTILAVFVVLK